MTPAPILARARFILRTETSTRRAGPAFASATGLLYSLGMY